MRDAGFKYKVGDIVTHIGFLKPIRQPGAQRFMVMSQTLEIGPGGLQRFYYVRPWHSSAEREVRGADSALRVQEAHLAPLPEEDS